MVDYYTNEMGKPPADPAPGSAPMRRPSSELAPQPVTIPPYPFSEWPFGGTTPVGSTLPNSQGGALMHSLAPTDMGKLMNDNHVEIYGWLNGGGNLSNAQNKTSGNFPAAYSYKPNVFQLDQAVVYAERLPDTVQKDHVDWGFRLSALYGETYRYTTSLGIDSYQLQKKNSFNGYDFPMVYGELYIPTVAAGMVIRAGRFISMPDIEAQLAPNNYMYSHSMTYAYDNYTNTGAVAGIQLDKNWMIQGALVDGTETALWVDNKADPGRRATFSSCLRWVSDTAYDSVFACANGINTGQWGYNNLQWYGLTYYHKFDERWHISTEMYNEHQHNVPDVGNTNPTPFDFMKNGPFKADCKGAASCKANTWTGTAYLNYKVSPMDNISWRVELFDDINGQRTGVDTHYFNYAIGWQHWLSPSITLRPEIAWYNAYDRPAFGGGTQSNITIVSSDVIWHF